MKETFKKHCKNKKNKKVIIKKSNKKTPKKVDALMFTQNLIIEKYIQI